MVNLFAFMMITMIICFVFSVTIAVVLAESQWIIDNDTYIFGCDGQTEPVTLSCPSTYKIIGIIKVGQRNRSNNDASCQYKPETDCLDRPSNLEIIIKKKYCMWKHSSCEFSRAAGGPVYCDNDFFPIFIIVESVACVKETNLHSQCSSKSQEKAIELSPNSSEAHYILSPGFMLNYREELTHLRQSTNYWECKHNITTTSHEYGVRLQSILMDLHPDDSLSVFDGEKWREYTGNRSFDLYLPTNNVQIVLFANQIRKNPTTANEGFAIKVSSFLIGSVTTSSIEAENIILYNNTNTISPSISINNNTMTKPSPFSEKDDDVKLKLIVIMVLSSILVIALACVALYVAIKSKYKLQRLVILHSRRASDDFESELTAYAEVDQGLEVQQAEGEVTAKREIEVIMENTPGSGSHDKYCKDAITVYRGEV